MDKTREGVVSVIPNLIMFDVIINVTSREAAKRKLSDMKGGKAGARKVGGRRERENHYKCRGWCLPLLQVTMKILRWSCKSYGNPQALQALQY